MGCPPCRLASARRPPRHERREAPNLRDGSVVRSSAGAVGRRSGKASLRRGLESKRPSVMRCRRAVGWSNGSPGSSGAGYGLKFSAEDRDHVFERAWAGVVLDLPEHGAVSVRLSGSLAGLLRSPERGGGPVAAADRARAIARRAPG